MKGGELVRDDNVIRTHDDFEIFLCAVDIDEKGRTVLRRNHKNKKGEIPLEEFLQDVAVKSDRLRQSRGGHIR